ncbi:MAG: hypothetical protein HN368_04455 [Spirochaetales bacterium]|jgi:hypothetical protein|nr:hypothetical protein [Spirochaetales bacterium]
MKKIVLCLLVCIAIVSCASSEKDPNAAAPTAYAGYASWQKVNDQPITGDATGVLGKAHEGTDGFREVYVNSTGAAVSTGGAALPYPKGTVILKEAFKNSDGSKGALTAVTVMVKRENGYDAGNGDWEYIMLNSKMKVKGQGKIGACISCHLAADNDQVFTDNR